MPDPCDSLRLRGALFLAAIISIASGTPSKGGETRPVENPEQESKPPGFFPDLLPNLFDSEDGMLDLSNTLDEAYGFFPLVMPITEPAVGTGVAFIPIFIDAPEDRRGRPNIWAAGAMTTNNGSQGYFAGYSGYFQEDKWHVVGGAADLSINLDFHGLGGITPSPGIPLRYNLDITGGLIGADRKIGRTPWRVGLRYLYGEVSPSLVRPSDLGRISSPGFTRNFGRFDFSNTVSSLQPALIYDTRDNIFTPTKGLYSELNFTANLTALGASDDFQTIEWTGIVYRPLAEDRLYLSWRADFKQSFGDMPFYQRPAITLRGAPAQRYQGAGIASTEAELRWQFHPRWSVLGFAGAGITWPGDSLIHQSETVLTGGVGLRYLIARRYGLHTGIDLAYGEEGAAVYIQFGSGWFNP